MSVANISIELEILNYNYRSVDVSFMKYIERINLSNFLEGLKEGCVSKNDPEWEQYHLDDVIENGGEDFNRIGSKRLQFCRDCGAPIYLAFPEEIGHF